MGMTSWSSASKTLSRHCQYIFFRSVCSPRSHNMLPHYIEPGTATELCAPVKVLACADCDNRIRICECGEDTDFVGVFELSANSHDC